MEDLRFGREKPVRGLSHALRQRSGSARAAARGIATAASLFRQVFASGGGDALHLRVLSAVLRRMDGFAELAGFSLLDPVDPELLITALEASARLRRKGADVSSACGFDLAALPMERVAALQSAIESRHRGRFRGEIEACGGRQLTDEVAVARVLASYFRAFDDFQGVATHLAGTVPDVTASLTRYLDLLDLAAEEAEGLGLDWEWTTEIFRLRRDTRKEHMSSLFRWLTHDDVTAAITLASSSVAVQALVSGLEASASDDQSLAEALDPVWKRFTGISLGDMLDGETALRPVPDRVPLRDRCLSLDIEATIADRRIHDLAVVGPDRSGKHGVVRLQYPATPEDIARGALEAMAKNDFVVGHNIDGLDLPLLREVIPGARTPPSIDTLKLSPLAFPDRRHHRLGKDYREDGTRWRNDPEADAWKALSVLWDQVSAFSGMDGRWLRCLHWLLTLGDDRDAYDAVMTEAREGKARPSSHHDVAGVLADIRSLFEGQVCLHGLRTALSATYRTGDGWPLAYALSWIRSRGSSPAPAEWVIRSSPGTLALVDDMRIGSCGRTCGHCRRTKDPLSVARKWLTGTSSPDDLPVPLMEAGLSGSDHLGIVPPGDVAIRCVYATAMERHAWCGDLTVVVSPDTGWAAHPEMFLAHAGDSVAAMQGQPGDGDGNASEAVKSGKAALLLVTPEKVVHGRLQQVLKGRRIGAWVFHQAHCIPEWSGHSREKYRKCVTSVRDFGAPGSETAPIRFLTATAPPVLVEELKALGRTALNIDLEVVEVAPALPDVDIQVRDGAADARWISSVMGPGDGKVVVYTRKREDCDRLARELGKLGHAAASYLTGNGDRESVEADFASGKTSVLLTTSAASATMDLSGVGLVIHAGLPADMVSLLQPCMAGGTRPRNVVAFDDASIESRFRDVVSRQVAKEDVDATLGFFLSMVVDRKKQAGTVFSAPYATIARDVLSVADSPSSRVIAGQARKKIDRIMDILERSGLVERVIRDRATTRYTVDPEARDRCLDKLRPYHHHLIAAVDVMGPSSGADRNVQDALAYLRRLGVLKEALMVELTDPAKGRKASFGTIGKSAEEFTRVLRAEAAILGILAARSQAGASTDVTVTIQDLWREIRDSGDDMGLTPKSIRDALLSLGRNGAYLQLDFKAMRSRSAIKVAPPHGWAQALSDNRRWQERLECVRRATKQLLGKEGVRGVDVKSVLVPMLLGDMTDLPVWSDAEGQVLPNRDVEILATGALRWMVERGFLYAGPGLFDAEDEVSVRFTDLNGTRRNSFSLERAALHLDPMQREEVSQIHVVEGFVRAVLTRPSRSPELASGYLSSPTPRILARLFPATDPKMVEGSRAASVREQVRSLELLDNEQRRIVQAGTDLGDTLILAGPGSGKTHVLVERIVWLVKVQGVDPQHVLALCFGRKAAMTIRSRLRARLGPLASLVSVHTYHAFALRVMGRNIEDVLDSQAVKDTQDTPAQDAGGTPYPFGEILVRATDDMRRHRESGGDLSDLVLQNYRWVFVDEYQDVTPESYSFVSEIAELERKRQAGGVTSADHLVTTRFCAVGDDDQNIYAYGGASGDFIRKFETDFVGVTRHELVRNYRSSVPIVHVAQAVLAKVADRMKTNPPVPMASARGRGGEGPPPARVKVIRPAGNTMEAHAATAVEALTDLAASGDGFDWGSTAVIVRRRKDIPVVERELLSRGIEVARSSGVPMMRVREAILVREAIQGLRRRGDPVRRDAVGRLLEPIARYAGFWADLVRNVITEMAGLFPEDGIPPEQLAEEFTEWAYSWKGSDKGVAVLTAHTAKGLEFDNVVVCDAGWRYNPDDTEVRLLYVALTRARHHLALVTDGKTGGLVSGAAPEHCDRSMSFATPHAGDVATYDMCNVKEVFLSFPAWAGTRDSDKIADLAERLQSGDRLMVGSIRESGKRRSLYVPDTGTYLCLGEMSQNFVDPRTERIEARVGAVIQWRKRDSNTEFTNRITRDSWWVVIPEIASTAACQPSATSAAVTG
jgi:Superfamily I DNA and RNA helicases